MEELGTTGRKVQFSWGGVYVGAAREKNLTINNNPVDVTADEDNGWRTLLEQPGERQVDITISGIMRNNLFKDAAINGPQRDTATILYPDGYVIEGTFTIASYTEGQPYNNAVTFTATLQSSGADVTGTPPTPGP